MDDGFGVRLVIAGFIMLLAAVAALILWYVWKKKHENVTEEDIKTMVNEGHERGVLETSEAEMISNIFEFDEKEAGDIMTHRKNITALAGEMLVKDAAQFVLKEANNSRFPVFGEDLDDIIGTVHIRELLVHAENPGEARMPIAKVPGLLREAHFIPETRKIASLFKEMQSQKNHMEIVIDEYGQTAGLVTMEDILEEIVGNILDEYDVDEQLIVQGENKDTWIMSGMAPLEDVQKALGIEFSEEDQENYDTINGLLISRLDRIPSEKERPEVCCQGFRFSVIKVENKMIASVRVTRLTEEELAALQEAEAASTQEESE